MFFQDKVDRARAHERKEMGLDDNHNIPEEYTGEKMYEPEIGDLLEKGDMPAMIFSALITIVPLCLVILLVMTGVAVLFFRLF